MYYLVVGVLILAERSISERVREKNNQKCYELSDKHRISIKSTFTHPPQSFLHSLLSPSLSLAFHQYTGKQHYPLIPYLKNDTRQHQQQEKDHNSGPFRLYRPGNHPLFDRSGCSSTQDHPQGRRLSPQGFEPLAQVRRKAQDQHAWGQGLGQVDRLVQGP